MNAAEHISRILDVLYSEYISYGTDETVIWYTKSFDLSQIETMIIDYNLSLVEYLTINEVDEYTLSWGDNKKTIIITTSSAVFRTVKETLNPKLSLIN